MKFWPGLNHQNAIIEKQPNIGSQTFNHDIIKKEEIRNIAVIAVFS